MFVLFLSFSSMQKFSPKSYGHLSRNLIKDVIDVISGNKCANALFAQTLVWVVF